MLAGTIKFKPKKTTPIEKVRMAVKLKNSKFQLPTYIINNTGKRK